MAKTLRGSMIVGYYKKDKEDFADHGQVVTIDDEGVHFECKTTPYGFVAPNAKVWFQTFEEPAENGEMIEREYLMTNGFLWTKAFPEANKVIEEGRPQSMELDKDSVRGTWTNSINNDYEVLIINDAIFSKLCILGEDVEPCFEGASVTKPETFTEYSLDNEFKNTVYSMMKELQQMQEGGKVQMEMENKALETPVTESNVAATAYVKDEEEDKKKNDTAASGGEGETEEKESASAAKEDGGKTEEKKEEDDKKKKENYSLNTVSLDEYNALKDKYSALEKTVTELNKFKAEVEREKKTELINKFTMLSDEEKSDVVTNIDSYTLDDIEAKLSIKCFRKGSFVSENIENSDNTVETETTNPITTYSLAGSSTHSNVDAWIRAVEENMNN